MRELAGLTERVERPGVQLAGLQADDGGSIRVRVERLLEQRQADPARVVGGKRDDRVGADAEQPDRAVERLVAELRGEHPQAGRAGEAVALNVDTAVVEQALPGRREAGHVRHLAAGHERKRGRRRQPEELLQPCTAHLLDDRGCRRGGEDRAVLIPGRCQPVRRDRRRQRAPDDPAEEAAAGRAEQAGVRALRELVQHLHRIDAVIGKGVRERRP